MPFFWELAAKGDWRMHQLDPLARPAVAVIDTIQQAAAMPRVQAFETETGTKWVLFAPQGLAILRNGTRLTLNLAVLADRDEILVADEQSASRHRLFFSTEQAAVIELVPEGLDAACPRCKQAIRPGSPGVCCPICHVWHDQSEDRPCWTYADHCAACNKQRTTLDGQVSWSPEEL